MSKLHLFLVAFVFMSSNICYAKSRSPVFLYVFESSLDGEPASDKNQSLSFYTGGVRYEEKTGLGFGGYYYSEINTADIKKAGFGLENKKEASFDATTIGIQIGYLFSTDTELTAGLGNTIVNISQDQTSSTMGAMDYRLCLSQNLYKNFGFSVFGRQSGEMTRRTSTESNSTKLTSFGIGLGYISTFED